MTPETLFTANNVSSRCTWDLRLGCGAVGPDMHAVVCVFLIAHNPAAALEETVALGVAVGMVTFPGIRVCSRRPRRGICDNRTMGATDLALCASWQRNVRQLFWGLPEGWHRPDLGTLILNRTRTPKPSRIQRLVRRPRRSSIGRNARRRSAFERRVGPLDEKKDDDAWSY